MSYSFILCFLSLGLILPIFCSQSNDSSGNLPLSSNNNQTSTQSPISTTGSALPNVTKFVLTTANGSVCAVVAGTFQLSINYTNTTGTDLTNTLYIDSSHGGFKVEPVEGSCGSNKQNLIVDFYRGWKFTFFFTRDSTEKNMNYNMNNLTLLYLVDSDHGFSNPKTNGSVFSPYTGNDLYTAKNEQNYLCKTKKTLTFGNVTLTVTDLQFQAFKPNASSSEFEGDINECIADNENDSNLVPIIVGVCLAALVLVILVAYFIGRWRTSRDAAYQPV